MEEEVGFEPTVRSSRTTVFKTAPINHSGTLPEKFLPSVRLFYNKKLFFARVFYYFSKAAFNLAIALANAASARLASTAAETSANLA